MTNSPALPAGFEVESVGKPSEVSTLPEGFEVESIPEEESLLSRTGRAVKGVLDVPENITKNIILPFSENIATQAVGGAGAVLSPAVAVRNYLTTLAGTGSPEKAYESASRGARETGEFFGSIAEKIPTTELGKKSSEYVAKGFNTLLEPVGGIAREAVRVPLQSLESAGLPRVIAKPIEDVVQVGSEFAAFGGLMKGGGKVKSLVRDIYNERKGMPPKVPTVEQFKEADVSPVETAEKEFKKPEVRKEYETFLDEVEGKRLEEERAWEGYERYPELPEGFEVESLPDIYVEKSSYVPSRDTRSATGDVSKIDMSAGKESNVVNLITKPTRDFHKTLQNEISEGVKNIQNKVNEYKGWKWEVGDRVKSTKTGNMWEVVGKTWNNQKDVPMYVMKNELAGEKSRFYAEPTKTKDMDIPSVYDGFTKLGTKPEVLKGGKKIIALGEEAEVRAQATLKTPKPKEGLRLKPTAAQKAKDILTGERGSLILGERKPFYSKLEEVINKDMKLSLPIDSARKMAYNKGVTVDEWNDAFAHLRGKVTKGQLLDELAVHGTKFEDVVLGEPVTERTVREFPKTIAELDIVADELGLSVRTYNAIKKVIEGSITKEEAFKLMGKNRKEWIDVSSKPVQFEHWSEPGFIPGSSRELFVTTGKSNKVHRIPTNEEFIKYYKDQGMGNTPSRLADLEFFYKEAVGKNEFEKGLLDSIGITTEAKWQDGHGAYSDIQNPIVRIRYNDREVGGKKVRFIEEIQGPSPENQSVMPESLRSRIYDIGVKRAISKAIEDGADEIAWTTGKMQADRYNLAKVIDNINWEKPLADKKPVAVYSKDGREVGFYTDAQGKITDSHDSRLIGKSIEEVVGKEVAKKILNSESGNLSNLDLEIGGEGLKRLYDEIIPGLMKKYGGEKIGKIDLQLEPTVTSQRLKIPGAGPQETIVSSLPLTDRAPSSFTMYSDPLGFQASAKVLGKVVEGAREGWEQVLERNPKIAKLDEKARNRIEEIYRGIKEGTLDPERVMREDPYAHEVIKNLFSAEESKNAFMQKVMPAFIEATRGIKKGSDSSMRIGKVLDGQAGVETLTAKERKAFDFFKSNYDWMIHEYARKAAGSEAAYQKVLNLVNNKQVKRSKIKDLSPEDKATYDQLRQIAREVRGDKKVSELDQVTREAYERASQEARDFLHNDFTKNLPEGEKAAYDILSRKLTDYLPHLFDKKDLKLMFEQDIAKLKAKLEKVTKKELITKYKNQIAELEKALSGLEGGKWINFRDLPRDVFFRFFQERKGAKGYSFDAVKAFESYVYGIARKIYDEPALRKSYELYEKVSLELKPYTKELVNHYMGYGEKSRFDNFARFVTTFEWIRTLGLNPRSALVNLTQRLNTAVWVGEKYAIQAQAMMLGSKAMRAKANEIFEKSGVGREIPQVLMEGPVAPSLQGLRSVTGVLFDMVERGNRQHALLSGYLKAKAKGMSEEAAIKEGIKIVHKTQFRYGKLGMAKWSRNPGGKLALQFLSYPMKQAQFLYDLYKKDRLAFLRFAAYTIGGNMTLQELLDTDMSNAIGFGITFGEALKAIQFAAEGDTKGAIRHAEQAFTPGGGMLPSGPGPAVASTISIGKAATQGKGVEQLVKEITPVMWTRAKQAYKAIKEREGNEYPIFDEKKHMTYRLNARQLAQRTLGPRSEKEHKESLKFREERNLEQERIEITKDIASKFADGILNDDEAAIDEAADLIVKYGIDIEDKQLENEIAARLMTKEERTEPGKKDTYQILREGEMIRDKYNDEED